MSMPCIVIIGSGDLLEALRASLAENAEVLTFADSEPLKALEAITTRQPEVVALERLFAATSRGAALINRIKTDPALEGTEIRVVSVDGTYRVSPRRARIPQEPREPSGGSEPAVIVVDPVPSASANETARNLDYRGTRRAPRFRMAEGTEAQVDGTFATIIDLSILGAQILGAMPLKPQQRVRMILGDDLGVVKCSASVAWASFEIPKGVSRYRAGVEFNDAEASAIDAFCRRHKS
ncbi:MAG: hypothetical protein ABW292_07465 [Vicinamibacterales bacterium]